MESANKMRIPLKICGFHLQFADSAYSSGFHNSSMQLCTFLIICLRISQTVLDSAKTVADSANLPIFGAILSENLSRTKLKRPTSQPEFNLERFCCATHE